jgi:hypothetical protein
LSKITPIDFDIVKEPWNKYELNDNTIVKVRQVLTRVLKKVEGDKTSYSLAGQTLTAVLIPENLKGQPDNNTYSQ